MVLYLIDSQHYFDENPQQLEQLNQLRENFPEKPVWVIWNKTDLIDHQLPEKLAGYPTLQMSAKTTKGLEELKQLLVNYLNNKTTKIKVLFLIHDTTVLSMQHYPK